MIEVQASVATLPHDIVQLGEDPGERGRGEESYELDKLELRARRLADPPRERRAGWG